MEAPYALLLPDYEGYRGPDEGNPAFLDRGRRPDSTLFFEPRQGTLAQGSGGSGPRGQMQADPSHLYGFGRVGQ